MSEAELALLAAYLVATAKKRPTVQIDPDTAWALLERVAAEKLRDSKECDRA